MAIKNRIVVFLKKYNSRLIFSLSIILVFFVFQNHYFSGKSFHFPSKGHVIKNIKENGKIVFSSGTVLILENEYSSDEKIKRTDTVILLEGKISGKIDQNLAPLMNTNSYAIEIDTDDIDSACSVNFVQQYPSALRRLVYFMPSASLFNNQKWQIATCKGKLMCNYALTLLKEERSVDMLCSGSIDNIEIAVTGKLVINSRFNGFSTVDLDITTESPEMISSWQFAENSISK